MPDHGNSVVRDKMETQMTLFRKGAMAFADVAAVATLLGMTGQPVEPNRQGAKIGLHPRLASIALGPAG